jgi:hypothetical protein
MRTGLALATVLLSLNAAQATAQEQSGEPRSRPASELLQPPKKGVIASPITDRFALRVMYFAPSAETFMRLDPESSSVQGTELLAEDDLGLEDKPSQARVEMIFRMRERNRLRVDFYKLTRYGDMVLNRPIAFGDEVFNVNDRVQTLLDWRELGLTYTRSILYRERFEIGVGLGIALVEAKARGEVRSRNIREEEDGVGPYPTFALDATWRISSRWSLNLRGQSFTVNRNDVEATKSDYHGDVQYRWRRNFTVGLGYSSLKVQADVLPNGEVGRQTGRLDQDISGPELFLRASF